MPATGDTQPQQGCDKMMLAGMLLMVREWKRCNDEGLKFKPTQTLYGALLNRGHGMI